MGKRGDRMLAERRLFKSESWESERLCDFLDQVVVIAAGAELHDWLSGRSRRPGTRPASLPHQTAGHQLPPPPFPLPYLCCWVIARPCVHDDKCATREAGLCCTADGGAAPLGRQSDDSNAAVDLGQCNTFLPACIKDPAMRLQSPRQK